MEKNPYLTVAHPAGPGEYYRLAVPGADGPAFTLAGKLPDASAAQSCALLPGPGHYEVPSTSSGAAFTIAGRVQVAEGQLDPTPGPGKRRKACNCDTPALQRVERWHASGIDGV